MGVSSRQRVVRSQMLGWARRRRDALPGGAGAGSGATGLLVRWLEGGWAFRDDTFCLSGLWAQDPLPPGSAAASGKDVAIRETDASGRTRTGSAEPAAEQE